MAGRERASPGQPRYPGEGKYGIRHDPKVIQAVAEMIQRGMIGDDIAKAVGISPASVETIVSEHPDLGLSRQRAREATALALVDEAQRIVDEPLNVEMDGKLASAGVTRARNMADFRWKRAAAFHPDLWGDRTQVDLKATVTVLSIFSDLVRPVAPLDVEGDSLPHVAAPDGGAEG